MQDTGTACCHGAKDTGGEKSCCGCVRHKHRDGGEYRMLMNRLKRIEGQVQGLEKMVEDDRYCVDILTQVSAVQSAINAFARELMGQHIRSCVATDIKDGRDGAVEELVDTVRRLMK